MKKYHYAQTTSIPAGSVALVANELRDKGWELVNPVFLGVFPVEVKASPNVVVPGNAPNQAQQVGVSFFSLLMKHEVQANQKEMPEIPAFGPQNSSEQKPPNSLEFPDAKK